MKVIAINKYQLNRLFYLNNFTFVLILFDSIRFYKNNKLHNKNGPAIIRFPNVKTNVLTRNKKEWYYQNRYFGSNHSFSNKSWKKYIKELRQEEKLRIFL